LLQEPLKYSEGQLHLPAGPGLGVELNMDAVKTWTRN